MKIFQNGLLICGVWIFFDRSIVEFILKKVEVFVHPADFKVLSRVAPQFSIADADAPLKLCGVKSQISASESTSLNHLDTVSLLAGPRGRAWHNKG